MSRIDRRKFLIATMASLAALGDDGSVASALPQRGEGAPNPRRIDVHHHFAPAEWMTAVKGGRC
jgi:hypothetical protein